ncbi:hypothetical protein DVH24_002151 [Malus domestica]|uniref:Uncharacterized protein n=1 Tax=Malus domestica TaxID=3750 RepID=A0A498IBX6_MALDO|nr:hypothetical protein DVH24_002151 [Malus domestica]
MFWEEEEERLIKSIPLSFLKPCDVQMWNVEKNDAYHIPRNCVMVNANDPSVSTIGDDVKFLWKTL